MRAMVIGFSSNSLLPRTSTSGLLCLDELRGKFLRQRRGVERRADGVEVPARLVFLASRGGVFGVRPRAARGAAVVRHGFRGPKTVRRERPKTRAAGPLRRRQVRRRRGELHRGAAFPSVTLRAARSRACENRGVRL